MGGDLCECKDEYASPSRMRDEYASLLRMRDKYSTPNHADYPFFASEAFRSEAHSVISTFDQYF